MDIGDEPVNTFPGFCGRTLLSPQRKFYSVVAQMGATLFLQCTEMLTPADFARGFSIVKSEQEHPVALPELHVGDKVARKSQFDRDSTRDIFVCGIYPHFIAVAETRTAFIPGGSFNGTGWTLI